MGVHQRIQENNYLAHDMLVSVIVENHKAMLGFPVRGSKTETVLGASQPLGTWAQKACRKKWPKKKAKSSAPTVGAELFVIYLDHF